jgi:phage terminase small subunit
MEPTKETTLNAKQQRFASEYCIDLNCTQAAIRAGYSKSTAYSIGSRLLKNVEVQDYIFQLQSNLEQTSGITKLRVLKGFESIAFSNIAAFHNTWIEMKQFDSISEVERAAIAEISTKTVKKNIGTKENPEIINIEYIRIKLYDRIQALTKISEMLGFFEATKFDISSRIDRLSDDDINKLTDQVISQAIEKSKHS